MPETKSLKEKELAAFQLFNSDGSLDIIIGSLLMNLGFDALGEASSTSLFTWIPVIIFSSIKNKYTLPRLTIERLDVDERKVHFWTTQSAVGMAIGLTLVSMFTLRDPFNLQSKIALPWNGEIRILTFGVICALGLLVAGWFTKFRRFYYYAAAVMGVSLVCLFLLPIYVPLFVSSIMMLVVGFKTMSAFSKKYPDPDAEKQKDESKDKGKDKSKKK